jgi:photosystem II stability/assembly factor-like uncharacterized protein
MLQRQTCPNGHQWEASADKSAGGVAQTMICPVCGAESVAAEASQASVIPDTRNELPPSPLSTLRNPQGDEPPAAVPVFSEPCPRLVGYEILGMVGRGGMGVVYRARQVKLKRLVALKMLALDRVAGAEELARFKAEAEAVARLQHPNIVHIYNIGRQKGLSYIVLEFVSGGSLAQKLKGTPQPPREAAELVETLARAVHHAHQHGIIHRDLKPANILLSPEGLPKITDFGLAKRLDIETGQTQSGAIMGTPSYMAPEQAEGKTREIGPLVDVYALGAILYELLTGRPPFRGTTLLETLHQVVYDLPQPPNALQPGVPLPLQAICLKCLQKNQADRYASAQELADELRCFLARPQAEPAPPTEPPYAQVKKRRRWTLSRCLLLVAALCVLGGLGLWLFGGRSQPYWESLRVGTGAEHFDRIAFPTRTTGFAASRQGLFRTGDGGKTWKSVLQEPVGRVYLLHFADERTGWLGTDQLRHTDDGGESWAPVSLPVQDGMEAVTGLVEDSGGWSLVGGSTTSGELALFRRRERATGWERLDPAATGCWGGQDGPYGRWFLAGLALLRPGQAVAVLYQGYEDGGALLRTEDGGDSWTTLPFKADQDLYAVHFADPKRGWLAGFHGTLWRTTDGGTTWIPQTNPEEVTVSCLAFAGSGNSFGLAPLWQGKVLMTTTGENWRSVEVPLGYSMPCAVVVDPGCAYVLGTDGRLAHYIDPRVAPKP